MSPEELRRLDYRVCFAKGWTQDAAGNYCLRGPDGREADAPRYSTDPVASRVLLDEMAADPRCVHITTQWFSGDGGHWMVMTDWEPYISVYADTLDIAICLAWLAWRQGGQS